MSGALTRPRLRLVLDTNVSIGGDQRTWLEQRLQEAQAGRWIIPHYHEPAYPAVKTPSAAREFWVPLFEQYGADLACESDGHILKRTVPLRADAQGFQEVIIQRAERAFLIVRAGELFGELGVLDVRVVQFGVRRADLHLADEEVPTLA